MSIESLYMYGIEGTFLSPLLYIDIPSLTGGIDSATAAAQFGATESQSCDHGDGASLELLIRT